MVCGHLKFPWSVRNRFQPGANWLLKPADREKSEIHGLEIGIWRRRSLCRDVAETYFEGHVMKQGKTAIAKLVLNNLVLGSVFLAGSAVAAQPPLTVVELFQSQGCSDCPPANANVMALSDRPDLLTLSFGVTYWDQLGWKDTFASPQYTARQWDYARGLHHSNVYTPQTIVNGKADITGRDRAELEALIRR